MIKKSISVVVPCFNEGKTICKNLEKIESFLSSHFFDFEIIAVNDGSVDNTEEELRRAKEKIGHCLMIINNKINTGKGKAVKDGMLASQMEVFLFLDADLAIPIEETEKFMGELEKGYDIAIASRFVPGLKIKKPVLWYRKYMEKIFRLMRMVIIGNYEIQDTQCGYKMFSQKAAKEIFSLMTVERFAFDAEIVYIATKKGYKIKELPITLQNPSVSSIRIVGDSWNMFCDLLRIRSNDVRGLYGKGD